MQVNSAPWIALFDSIHHVMAAEEMLKTRGVWCDLTPVPRELSSDCAMALEFRECDLPAVRTVLSDPRVRVRSVHRPGPGGYEDMTETVVATTRSSGAGRTRS
jgi:hypothetical protein